MQAFGGLLFIVAGIFGIAFPNASWYMSTGWRFKNAEPSDVALFMNRLGGAVAAIVGLVVIVSSCSQGGGSGAGYGNRFQSKLLKGEAEVREIRVGFGADARALPEEDMNRAVELMANSAMTPFDPGTAYGASGEATIVYADGMRDDLLLFGPSGGIELHPSSSSKAYKFESPELESLFRTWLDRP